MGAGSEDQIGVSNCNGPKELAGQKTDQQRFITTRLGQPFEGRSSRTSRALTKGAGRVPVGGM
ncbi:hypothetical protein ZHAS_00019983 [Anopheles sinensis]|uniref:Uncharacterized protein n=1 Tax=Anopheles sinensis TaxID=74873 RepID=A0A084WNN3_ANOSI|nr:hypothetical protein ZHAS_00019983 [Anopheles sinensis]